MVGYTSKENNDSMKVLMVDDEECSLNISKMSLKDADQTFIMFSVSTPREALNLLSEQPFDCIVSDYIMPDMNGINLCQEVKNKHNIPFILYTGRGSEEVAEKAFKAGVDDYVRKEKTLAHFQVLAKRIRYTVEKYRAEEKIQGINAELSATNEELNTSLEEQAAIEEELRVANEELRAQTEALRERTDLLRHAQEIARLGSWELDLSNNRLSWSDEVYKIFGLSPNEFEATYAAFLDAVYPDDRDAVDSAYSNSLQDGCDGYEIEHRIVRKSTGEIRVVHEKCEHLRDLSGRIRKSVGMVHDITERREMEDDLKLSLQKLRKSEEELARMNEELSAMNEELQASEEELRVSNEGLFILNKHLKESEEKYRTLYERMSQGITFYDGSLNRISVNPAAERILGIRSTELVNRKAQSPIINAIAEDGHELTTDEYPIVISAKTRKPVNEVIIGIYNQIDKNLHWVKNDITPLFRPGEETPYMYFAIFEDVTELKEAEEKQNNLVTQLEKERKILQSVMDGAKNMHLVYLDKDFNFVRVNKAYADTCGYQPYEMIGKNHFNLYPNQENESIFKIVRDTGEPVTYYDKPFEFPDQPDRGITYWDWTLEPIKNDSEKVEGLVFSLVETTERRKVEESLRASYEQLSKSEKQLADINGELKATNEELLEAKKIVDTYASRLEEMVDERTKDVLEARQRLESFMNSAIEGFFIYSKDFTLINLNPAALSLFPKGTKKEDLIGKNMLEVSPGVEKTLRYEGYKRVLISGEPYIEDNFPTLSNLGDLWASVRAFKMGEDLGIMWRDVTDQMKLEEKLRESQRLEAIDKISAMVAHDIRSPLITASQALDMAKKKPERGEDLYTMAERNISRAVQMIEELRENTRLVNPKKSEIDLRSLIEDTVKGMSIYDSVVIVTDFNGQFKDLHIDPNMFRRVIENFLMNAIDAMPDGGKIQIRIWREGDEVLISVTDSGIGIPEENYEKIFTPLFTTKTKGVGLGLSFCKRAIEAHGGSISFNSRVGEGTTFITSLPYKTTK